MTRPDWLPEARRLLWLGNSEDEVRATLFVGEETWRFEMREEHAKAQAQGRCGFCGILSAADPCDDCRETARRGRVSIAPNEYTIALEAGR